jgi:hypothetical protein
MFSKEFYFGTEATFFVRSSICRTTSRFYTWILWNLWNLLCLLDRTMKLSQIGCTWIEPFRKSANRIKITPKILKVCWTRILNTKIIESLMNQFPISLNFIIIEELVIDNLVTHDFTIISILLYISHQLFILTSTLFKLYSMNCHNGN